MQRLNDTPRRMKYLKPIDGDVYNISRRIKEIDKGYFIVRNFNDQVFEVHNSKNKGRTFCFTVPYPELDERTIVHCKKTAIARADLIIKEIERANEKAEKAEKKEAFEKYKDQALESRSYFKKAAELTGL